MCRFLSDRMVAFLVVYKGYLAVFTPVLFIRFRGNALLLFKQLIYLGVLVALSSQKLIKPPRLQILTHISAEFAFQHRLCILHVKHFKI